MAASSGLQSNSPHDRYLKYFSEISDNGVAPPEIGEMTAPRPHGEYASAVRHGELIVTAGMTPRVNGDLWICGTVGRDVTEELAREAAMIAASNALDALTDMAGSIENIARCIKLTVYIACDPSFSNLSQVADGASQFLVQRLGQRGLAARTSVGVASLPSGAPVEVDLMAAQVP